MKFLKCKKNNTMVKVRCCSCYILENIENMFADLDGQVFFSYYCEDCINYIIKEI